MFVFIVLVLYFQTSRTDFCTNKSLIVHGLTERSSAAIFTTTSPVYHAFRTKYNINVFVKVMEEPAIGRHITRGLTEPVVDPSSVAFVVSPYDVPKQDNQLQFPVAAQGVVIIYNLPGITNLNLTVKSVSQIYRGIIKYWNDSTIQEVNPNVELPFQKILPIVRKNDGATTYFFTRLLSKFDSEWNKTYGTFIGPAFAGGVCCNSTTWPRDVIYMYGQDVFGIAGVIYSLDYSIGYTKTSTIFDYDISTAGLIANGNNISNVVFPSRQSMEKAMWNYAKALGNEDNHYMKIEIDSFSEDAYPLTAFACMMLYLSYDSKIDCCVIQELLGFIKWLYSEETDMLISSVGFVPILDEIHDKIIKIIADTVRCGNNLMYPQYLATYDSPTSLETWKAVLIGIGCIAAIGVMIAIALKIYAQKFYIDESCWLVNPNLITVVQRLTSFSDNKSKSAADLKSATTSFKSAPGEKLFQDATMISGEMGGNKVYFDHLDCKIPQHWSLRAKRTLSGLKNLVNKNITMFLGVTTIEHRPHSIFEYCSKGTLHFVLSSSRYDLSDKVKQHFTLDVAHGLKYLHQHGIIHGYLSSLSCYLDSSWTVKISQWEKLSIYQTENLIHIKSFTATFGQLDEILEERIQLIELLYVDPRLVSMVDQYVDVFSFGFLLLEIFSRKLPYADMIINGDDTYGNILMKKLMQNQLVHPTKSEHVKDVYDLSLQCLGPHENRPNMKKICHQLESNPNSSEGIIDIIMDVLEKHADILEERVQERTAELKQVTNKMRTLLNEVLPPQIADRLLKGLPVPPEQFECVSVYFSDIVGFTTISARSTPIEVMTFLNDLWLLFDRIIEKYDVYKVDTIGDAYMVCSGLPMRNGMEHCQQISFLALHLLEECNRFQITHLPEEQLKIRIGINSGPVTAGVVGSKMPQYCVFGDTVNTAARMESTSLPQKIQMSERTNKLIQSRYPGIFQIAYRGEIEVKGKGDMRTYWLLAVLSS